MIPHTIHYCWFGQAPLPPLAEQCIASWKKYMPEWQIMRWDETNFDIASTPLYVHEANETRKFAFVSDYVRLWALEQYGGVYVDTDVKVLQSYEPLLSDTAFIGMEQFYPVNDERNNKLADAYRSLAAKEPNVIFGGRLAEYKYYDMDKVIKRAMQTFDTII